MQWILGIALAALLFVVLRRWAALDPQEKKRASWKLLLWVTGALLLFMVLTGRVHVLVAGVAALLPLLRKLPALLRFAPFLSRLYRQYRGPRDESGQQRQQSTGVSSGGMSRREACDTLGVEEGCSDDDIIAAHRRLMQKLHPDRGGNDYLAARVNEAKSVLLGPRRK